MSTVKLVTSKQMVAESIRIFAKYHQHHLRNICFNHNHELHQRARTNTHHHARTNTHHHGSLCTPNRRNSFSSKCTERKGHALTCREPAMLWRKESVACCLLQPPAWLSVAVKRQLQIKQACHNTLLQSAPQQTKATFLQKGQAS